MLAPNTTVLQAIESWRMGVIYIDDPQSGETEVTLAESAYDLVELAKKQGVNLSAFVSAEELEKIEMDAEAFSMQSFD